MRPLKVASEHKWLVKARPAKIQIFHFDLVRSDTDKNFPFFPSTRSNPVVLVNLAYVTEFVITVSKFAHNMDRS